VIRVGFVGTRTSRTEATTAFFRDVLGLEALRDDPEWSVLQLPSGPHDYLEVYGAEFNDDRLFPRGADAAIAFIVDDLVGAHDEIRAVGIETTDIVWAAEAFDNPDLAGYGWFFFTAPDDHLYVIQQVPS